MTSLKEKASTLSHVIVYSKFFSLSFVSSHMVDGHLEKYIQMPWQVYTNENQNHAGKGSSFSYDTPWKLKLDFEKAG